MSEKLPIFRRKCAYGADCYNANGKKLVLIFPFVPRRNAKAPEYWSFCRSSGGPVRHFRFHSLADATTLNYREVPSNPHFTEEKR